jgi:carboxypeptidase family protein/TonB-dependent receptor-like protein
MKSNATKILVLTWALGLLFSATPLRAQVAGATLSGTITDPQGGAVVGAKVAAKNGATGISTETTTNSSGAYSIVNLIPANYDVSVSATGFRTATSKLTLTVGAQQAMNIALTVGEVSQTVEVTGAAPVIEMENATLSGNIQSAQILELPLNGRDWASLATLEPGVVSVRPHESVDQPGGNLRGLGAQMTIDGNRPTQNVYRLNGIIVNDYSNAGPGNVLGASVGVDAIQEFSVLTANYSAEYGFTSGGVINAVTKSGTNQFHGSLYEFLRNAAFDSSNYIDGPNKGAFTRNQFGGSGGGPIKKNKIFIFGDYEGLRQRKGIPGVAQVLTPNARLGIINDGCGNPPGTAYANPAAAQNCTPTSGGPFVPNPVTTQGVPGAGNPPCPANASQNQVMTNLAPGKASICVDNFVESFTNALDPLPTCDVTSPSCLVGPDNNSALYTFSGKQAVTDNYVTLRGDVKLSEKDSLNSSWYWDHSSWAKPDPLNLSTSGYIIPNQAISVEENHVFSASMVNSLRLGYTQSIVRNPGIAALLPSLVDTQFGMTSSLAAPGISPQGGGGGGIGNLTSFGGFSKAGGFSDWVHNLQVFDDASRTFGKHSVKFGFLFLRNHTDLVNGNGTGSAAFLDLPSYLQSITLTVRMPTSPPFTSGNTKHYNRNSVFGAYVQDDWKMRSNLTVNLGLRYEMSTIPYEISRKFRILPTLWTNPGGCVEDINGLPVDSTCTALRDSVFVTNPTLRNFEPRVGFAWDPFKSGKTSVRGGVGMFDVLPMPYMFGLNALQASPAGAEVDLTSGVPQGAFDKGYAAIAASTSPSAGGRFQYTDSNPRRNYVMQWNANVQRQITTSTSVTLAYAGSRGIHNPFQTDTLNTVFPTKTSAGWLFPVVPSIKDPTGVIPTGTLVACSASVNVNGNPTPLIPPNACGLNPATPPTGIVPGNIINPYIGGLILSTIFQSQSWYNSFQANVTKKFSHSFQVEASFTWQKSLDTSSGSFAGDNYLSNPTAATPWWDLAITKGPSDFNVSRNLSINWLLQVPTPASFSGPAGWIARGWGVEGLLELSDGSPIWPLTGLASDPLGQINAEPMSIPDLAPGCTPQNAVQPGNLQYLKPQCFVIPSAPAGFDPTHTKCDQGFIIAYNAKPANTTKLGPDTCANLLGHLPRNSIVGPGLFNVDMSFVKDNHIKKLGESFNVQFRAEMFNIFNRTNYAPPTAHLIPLDPNPQGSFGVIDQPTQVPMREMQFALKIVF